MKLYRHQEAMVATARANKRWYYQADCGVGKTIAMLSVCAERPMRTLVLAPKSIVESAWCGDAKHFPALKVIPVLRDTKSRASVILRGEWDVAVTNYDQFRAHWKDYLAIGVRRLVIDEASKIKNPDAAITKTAIAFADRMEEVYALSANAAPNGPHELWATLRATHATQLVPIKWLYRYFYPVKENVRVKGGQVKAVVRDWRQSPGQKLDLETTLRAHATVLTKADCLDLPPQVDRVIRVRLSPAEAEAYRRVEEELRLITKDGTATVKAGAALIKLRQIVGGAVLVDGVPCEVGTSKIDALADVLDEIGPGPVVVWTQFVHERERIEKLLVERKETYGIIDGSTSSAAGLTAAMFQDGRLQRLLAHPQAAGHGITLHAASHAVYFSLDFSHDGHKQSRDRIHRSGMKDTPATYHYLMAELPDGNKTIDDSMAWTLRTKARAAEGMIRAVQAAGTHATAGV